MAILAVGCTGIGLGARRDRLGLGVSNLPNQEVWIFLLNFGHRSGLIHVPMLDELDITHKPLAALGLLEGHVRRAARFIRSRDDDQDDRSPLRRYTRVSRP